MCTPEEREKRIRAMMSRKSDKAVEKMNSVVEKITGKSMPGEIEIETGSKFIPNSYEITDPTIWPQIAKGEAYIKSLDKGILDSLIHYTGFGYSAINGALRGSRDIDRNPHLIRNIDTAFRRAPRLEAPMTVYRGVRNITELRDDNGFSSCSLKKSMSVVFGGGKCFTITIPTGSRVLFLNPISLFKGENEVLIDRSGSFRALLEVGQLVYVSQLNEDDD